MGYRKKINQTFKDESWVQLSTPTGFGHFKSTTVYRMNCHSPFRFSSQCFNEFFQVGSYLENGIISFLQNTVVDLAVATSVVNVLP